MMEIINKRPVDLLLIEDRVEDAELAMMALQDHNLINEIKWVRDGREALDFLHAKGEYEYRKTERNPKIVLLDLKMPKVDGIQVLKEIRSNEKTKSIPVVVLTTSKADKDKAEAYSLGLNSYIIKPVEFENFTKSVRELGFYWLLLNESLE